MSDSEEMEEFGMDDEDMNRMYNPGMSRRKKMTKEEAMLGIWASKDSSNEDEDDAFSFNNQKRSKTVSFVTASKRTIKPENDVKEEKIDDESEDEEENEAGFKSERAKAAEEIIYEDDDSDEEAQEANNNYLIGQFKKGNLKPAPNESKQTKAAPSLSKKEINEIGNWGKYDKGIGMKLLQKMGWEKGKGLGKELQGRAVPVEAAVRKGKGAIGAHGSEYKDPYQDKSRIEPEDQDKAHVAQWKKQVRNRSRSGVFLINNFVFKNKSKKPSYQLKTADQLLAFAEKNPEKMRKIDQAFEYGMDQKKPGSLSSAVQANKVKIIDMTGKEQKVVHGYESLAQLSKLKSETDRVESAKKNFDLPELMHNLDLLVGMTEERIVLNDKKVKYHEDMIVSLTYDEKKSRDAASREKANVDRLTNLLDALSKCEKSVHSSNVTLSDLIEAFQTLKTDYADEFIIYNLYQLAIPLFTPVLKRKMSEWSPFDQSHSPTHTIDDDEDDKDDPVSPIYCASFYLKIKEILSDSSIVMDIKQEKGRFNLKPYHRVVWETWMPAFRRLMLDIRLKMYSVECVDLLNAWTKYGLLPNWVLENILDQIVLPKLNEEVEEWNPLTDTTPIHVWTLPWLPLMKRRLDSTIFPIIRQKLAAALMSWHPSDHSAKAILMPWRPPVFAQDHWNTFMLRNIVPKLELVLNQFILNPSEQQMEPWNWVMAWQDLIPLGSLANLLDTCFFPKWLQVLSVWLNASPNYEEISKWYSGWKSSFSEKLLQHPSVKAKLAQALTMMSKSVNGAQVSYNPNEQVHQPTPKPTTSQFSEAMKVNTYLIHCAVFLICSIYQGERSTLV